MGICGLLVKRYQTTQHIHLFHEVSDGIEGQAGQSGTDDGGDVAARAHVGTVW